MELTSFAYTEPDRLNIEAARRLYAIPQVIEVRREDTGRGVTFWVIGNHFDDDALDAIDRTEDELFDAFPDKSPLIEVKDLFGHQRLHSSFWEALVRVRRVPYSRAT